MFSVSNSRHLTASHRRSCRTFFAHPRIGYRDDVRYEKASKGKEHMMKRAITCLGFMAGLLASTSIARAQSDEELGGLAFAEGRFLEAAAHFQACLETTGELSCAFNQVAAYRAAQKNLEAEAALEQMLAGRWGALSPLQLEETIQRFEEVTNAVSTLELTLESPVTLVDVVLKIDDELYYEGEAHEVFELRVNPGEHNLIVESAGIETLSTPFSIEAASRVPLMVKLTASNDGSKGTLIVRTGSATDQISVEGQGSAVGELNQQLPAGEYRVRVTAGGDGSKETTVRIEPGQTVEITLNPRGRTPSFSGSTWFWVATGAVVLGAATTVFIAARNDDNETDPLVANDRFGTIEALRAAGRP